jgi:kynurenine formamidase
VWVDLTVKIKESNLVYPGDEPLVIKKVKDTKVDGYNLNQLSLNMHLGTHLDFKNHFYSKTQNLDFTQFMGKANVIKPLVVQGVVLTSDLAKKYHEQTFQERILILNLNHADKFNTKSYYEEITFEPSIYHFLVENNIKILGADLPSFSYLKETDFKMHKDLLKLDMFLLENLANLNELTNHVYLVALPLSIEGIEASLVRAVAKNI